MKRRAFLVVVAATSGCLDYLEENGNELSDPEDVVIVYDTLGRDDPGTDEERVYVWGVVRNDGDREINYLEIQATFFDENGDAIDSVIEHAEDVTSGEEWTFEIEFPQFGEAAARVADYELEPATSV
ncbi:FxLYD domain-containing protein [Natribaculum luteum]|uniref:FxLYD domain-containing protein n=1 Tax=Natribaculum luteum TaxID=1586232 RepID=A0ABD5P0N2_9EURY|nr:FxLYD domain-containing protein [Natribaculum luteum]